MTSADFFDPEIRALLSESMHDPESCLGKVPTEKLSSWLPGSRESLSAMDSRLTTSETYLLEIHREELAELAYWETFRLLALDGENNRLFANGSALSQDEWHSRKGSLEGGEGFSTELSKINSWRRQEPVPLRRLATLALQLASRPVGHGYLSLAVEQDGDYSLADNILRRALSKRNPAHIQGELLNLRCRFAFRDGEYSEALGLSMESIELGAAGISPSINLLINSMIMGDAKNLQIASEMMCEFEIKEIDSAVATCRGVRVSDVLPGRASRTAMATETLSEEARRITNVLT